MAYIHAHICTRPDWPLAGSQCRPRIRERAQRSACLEGELGEGRRES